MLSMTNMQKPRIHFSSNRNVSRRSFLRGAGVAMSLPMLDAMAPAFAREAAAAPHARDLQQPRPRPREVLPDRGRQELQALALLAGTGKAQGRLHRFQR